MAQDTKTQEPQTQQPKETSLQSVNFDEGLVPALQNGNLPQNPQRELPQTDGQTALDLEAKLKADAVKRALENALSIDDQAKELKFQIGSGPMENNVLLSANPHDVPLYKKTSPEFQQQTGEKFEFMGPLTVKAFKETDFYKEALTKKIALTTSGSTPEQRETFDLEGNATRQVDKSFGIEDSFPNARVLVQSKLVDGKFVPSKIIVGHYEDRQVSQDEIATQIGVKLAGNAESKEIFGKQIQVDSVIDRNTDEKYKIEPKSKTRQTEGGHTTLLNVSGSAIVIPLSDNGALLQPAADELAGKTKELEQLLDITKPQKSGANTQVHMENVAWASNRMKRTANRMLSNVNNMVYGPSPDGVKPYGLTMSNERLEQLEDQIDRGRYNKILVVTEKDAAGKETSRILLGHARETNAKESLTGQPVENVSLDAAFNVENGKASFLEKAEEKRIELKIADDRTRQGDIDTVVTKMREAAKRDEVSMAPAHPFQALVPDKLPAGGLAYSGVDVSEPFSSGTTSAKTKTLGRTPAEVA